MPKKQLSLNYTLDELVQKFLADVDFQQRRDFWKKERFPTLPDFQTLTLQFIHGACDLDTFRQEFSSLLRRKNRWGADGPSFMMEINKLGKYHNVAGERL